MNLADIVHAGLEQQVARRRARLYLETPVVPTGFDVPMDFAKEPGRAMLVQVPEFIAPSASTSAVQRPADEDREVEQ